MRTTTGLPFGAVVPGPELPAMNWLSLSGSALLGFGVSFLILVFKPAATATCRRARDAHHIHEEPVPRLGGLALLGAFLALEFFLSVYFPEHHRRMPCRGPLVWGSLGMFALGFWDDVRPLGAKRKLLGQVLIAVAVWSGGVAIEGFEAPFTQHALLLGPWSGVVTVLWLVGITNLMNLVDGVDGLAGGIALMLMALLVYVGYQNNTFVFLTAGLTGALVAFLWFNFPPARVYLGDGGAYLLGFQIGVLSIVGSHKGSVLGALIAPLFVLALPIADTTLAILRRGLRGLPVFRPDRRHIHHRLLGMGLSRRRVVLSLYGVTLVFLALGFVASWSRGEFIAVLSGGVLLVLLICAGRLSFSREWFAVGRTVGSSLAMRQEIQYALSLTRWLELEARRGGSAAELWEGLVFVGSRLGFSSMKATLPEGEREWERPEVCGHLRSFRQGAPGASAGLELAAPQCLGLRNASEHAGDAGGQCTCEHAVDGRLFELLSELVAEGWAKAVTQGEARTESKEGLLPGVKGHRPARAPCRQAAAGTEEARPCGGETCSIAERLEGFIPESKCPKRQKVL